MSLYLVICGDEEVMPNDKLEITPFATKEEARKYIIERAKGFGANQHYQEFIADETKLRFCFGPFDYAIRRIDISGIRPQ